MTIDTQHFLGIDLTHFSGLTEVEIGKVQLFQEGPKNLRNLSHGIV